MTASSMASELRMRRTMTGLVCWGEAAETRLREAARCMGLADARYVQGRNASACFAQPLGNWEDLHEGDGCCIQFAGYLLPSCYKDALPVYGAEWESGV